MSSTDRKNAFGISLTDASKGSAQFPRIHVKWHAAVQMLETFANVKVVEAYSAGLWLVGDIAYVTGSALSLQISVPDPSNRSQYHLVSCQVAVVGSVLTRHGFRTDVTIKSMMFSHQEMLNTWLKVGAEA